MGKFILLLCLITLSFQAHADNRPPWMRGDMPEKSNESYYFKVVQAEGSTQSEARHNVVLSLIGELARSQGVTITGRDIMQTLSESNNGKYSEKSSTQTLYSIETAGFKACFDVVDEYYDNKSCWILFQVAYVPDKASFDKVEFTTNYKGSAIWRSMLVPGWGQMHKKSTGKGITILTTQVLSVAGIFVCDNLSSSYYNKALNERNTATREQYQDRSTSFRNVRNGLIIAASAIYVYNIIDAISAKGAKRYKVGVSPNGISFAIKL